MKKRYRTPARFPTAKPTVWHKDKSKPDRKKVKLKIKKGDYDDIT
jgi:hypothetical protein